MSRRRVSGGKVSRVVLHPLVFSRTDLSENPQPVLVAWGGVVGVIVAACLGGREGMGWRYGYLLRFFAGFCLVGNGHTGGRELGRVGDAGELLARSPQWTCSCSDS